MIVKLVTCPPRILQIYIFLNIQSYVIAISIIFGLQHCPVVCTLEKAWMGVGTWLDSCSSIDYLPPSLTTLQPVMA